MADNSGIKLFRCKAAAVLLLKSTAQSVNMF